MLHFYFGIIGGQTCCLSPAVRILCQAQELGRGHGAAQELGGCALSAASTTSSRVPMYPGAAQQWMAGKGRSLVRDSVKSHSLDKEKVERTAGYTGCIQVCSTAAFWQDLWKFAAFKQNFCSWQEAPLYWAYVT